MSHTDIPFDPEDHQNENDYPVTTASATNSEDQDTSERNDSENSAFIEGESYDPVDVLQSDLDLGDQLEITSQRTFAATIDGKYVTFEVESFNCIDVTDANDVDMIETDD